MKSDKRIILAIVLSSVILLGYPSFMNKFFPQAMAPSVASTTDSTTSAKEGLLVDAGTTPISTQKRAKPSVDTIRELKEPSMAPSVDVKEELVTIETPLYTAVFTNIGAAIKSFKLNDYDKSAIDEGISVDIAKSYGWKNHLSNRINIGGQLIEPAFTASIDAITLKDGDKKELVFRWRSVDGLQLEKLYTFTADDYLIETETRIINETPSAITGIIETELTRAFDHEKKVYYHKGAIKMVDDDIERHDVDDQELSGKDDVAWLGIEEKYFITAIFPKPTVEGTPIDWTTGVPAEDTARVLMGETFTVGYNSEETYKSDIFIGPKEYHNLKAKGDGFEESIEFGFFSFMAKP
ncbi:MAG: membrane protein insertase YidC, partial [Deltaproteobacteria bacterium]|nr:membrane protein insertase YidC [Deltaproteobacteria bacterium]